MQLHKPTKQLIDNYVEGFKHDYGQTENAIQSLIEKFPDNKSFESVLLKSIVINVLYATQIRAIVPVASHIFAQNIDEDMLLGLPDVVDRIAKVAWNGKQRNNYSFATKYCSFHHPAAYPIYDSYVEKLLVAYRKRDAFAEFTTYELRDYKRFKQVLNEFKGFYGLAQVSFKELDIFLWRYGKELFG